MCAIRANRLTIRGVGGRARIDAAGRSAEDKAVWVVKGSGATIENIEISGASVPHRNGAAIRLEGRHLTLRRVYFHGNENGLLTGNDPESEILIEHSEFARNGFGDGQSHNLYIGAVKRLVFRYNYSHHARIGHELKSRAVENHILYNRMMTETDGTGSYEIEIAQGGTAYIIGNLIQQGPRTDNPVMVSFAVEGAKNPGLGLYVVNNTFVNDLGKGVFVRDSTSVPALVMNNLFIGGGTPVSQPGAAPLARNNLEGDALLAGRDGFDYRLGQGSPAIDAGADPGSAGTMSLRPVMQYVHRAGAERRPFDGAIDAGAYEFAPRPAPR
ncbi:MAG: right-handed parallel beta-helix repeat-containing protein [Burkholderiales bacterium]|nr:right-handed parallel beta-helix repeat-containing protein [Burkholderiales bacterium]